MKRTREDEGARWLSQAEEDLKDARVLLREEGYYLVCFLAQQVAEKALKAFLYFKGEELIIGHSVEKLSEWAGSYDRDFEKLREESSILDSYYIPACYPNGLPESIPAKVFNRKAAEESLKLAERVAKLVKEKIR